MNVNHQQSNPMYVTVLHKRAPRFPSERTPRTAESKKKNGHFPELGERRLPWPRMGLSSFSTANNSVSE